MSTPDIGDTADLIGPDAYDPDPAEVTDPNDPGYVVPDPHATPIGGDPR